MNTLSPTDFFLRLKEIIERPYAPSLYSELYRVMRQVCALKGGGKVYSNFFTLLGCVCRDSGVEVHMSAALQDLRRRCSDLAEQDSGRFQRDVLLLACFIEKVGGQVMPGELRAQLPPFWDVEPAARPKAVGRYRVLRARVLSWDEQMLYVRVDSSVALPDPARVDYACADNVFAAPYLKDIIHTDSTINLLDAELMADATLRPRWIILEPDFLMSPSELAAVFEPQGARPELYLLKAFQPTANTFYTLLGNTSGQMLDDLVFEPSSGPATYAGSLMKAFRRAPVDFSLLMSNGSEAQRFHTEARAQFLNLAQTVRTQMEPFYGFDLKKALLEPSFVCPAAGLAGRMDYLQSDATRLIEQKSGKRDEYRHTHREPHFVQMMLYRLMLDYTVGTDAKACETYLLYSRYPDGLMQEKPYMALLGRAIEMRNRIVSLIERIANGESEQIFSNLHVEDFRDEGVSDKLWIPYIRPRLEAALAPFAPIEDNNIPARSDFAPASSDVADESERKLTARSLFYRYYNFLMREQWLGRMGRTGGNNGNEGVGAGGYADLWNNPAIVRLESGDMLMGLEVRELVCENGELRKGKNKHKWPKSELEKSVGAVVAVKFRMGERMKNIRTNFRLGDSVQIYSYDGEEPCVWRQCTLRGRLARIGAEEVVVSLHNAQHNRDIFTTPRPFAMEHDRVESSNTVLERGLFAFLTAPAAVQDRFLLRSLPPVGVESELLGDYGSFNSIVRQERAAGDLFLVIGPPGSGKTSCALRFMVEEELRAMSKANSCNMAGAKGASSPNNSRQGCILLLAYTNRAVDELCFMLEDIIRTSPTLLSNYLRLGNELGASRELRGRLLSMRAQNELRTAKDVLALLNTTRVVVATTTTMSRQQLLMQALHFSVAFVDEASQILEPYLLPILMTGSVDKLVLVGDQKQLPAVVVESSADAAIHDERLNALGFTSCARSMFDRMLHRLIALRRTDLFTLLQTQGRMHPALFDFVNHHFYNDNLRCVPLCHQVRPLSVVYPKLPVVNNRFFADNFHSQPLFPSIFNDQETALPHIAALLSALATHRVLFIDCEPDDDGVNDKVNSREAQIAALCLHLFSLLYAGSGRSLGGHDAGIIVPYRNQISMIASALEAFGLHALEAMSIDTVERYQGSQRDIIIYSFTVRHAMQLDFLCSSTYQEDDNPSRPAYMVDRKLNVALTRAREQTVLIGNAALLRRNPIFRSLLSNIHVFHFPRQKK